MPISKYQQDADDKKIPIPKYGNLPHLVRDPDAFLKQTTILYGASKTGKSTIMNWIFEIIYPYIPNILVINPTNSGNGDFEGRVPDELIITDINLAAQKLRDVLQKQKVGKAIFNKANDIKILSKVCDRINDLNTTNIVAKITKKFHAIIGELESSSLNYAERTEQIKAIKDKMNEKLRQIYKKTIEAYRQQLSSMKLTMDERYAVKFMNYNNNFLLIMNDCAYAIEKWGKDESLSEIFFNGRHWDFTSFYTMQDDKKMTTDIRKNTFISIFTDANSAIGFFRNTANSFNTQVKKNADLIANYLFQPNPNGVANFKKFAYCRMDYVNPFRYVLVDECPPRKLGSTALWEFCRRIPKDDDATTNVIKEDSKFFKSFSV